MTFRFAKYLRFAAVVTLLVFTTQTMLQAAPASTQRSNSDKPQKLVPAPLSLKSPEPKILINRGKIEEQFLSKSTPFIYLVEDAHDSQDAQESIRQILKQLVENEKVSLVCFEGGSQKLDRTFYDFTHDSSKNIRIWDELFKQGQIGGLERYALEASESVKFSGLENKKIYFENIHSIQRIFRDKENVAGVLKQVDQVFDELASRLITGDAKKIRDLKRAFDSGRLNLLQYASELVRGSEFSQHVAAQQDQWPQLARLLKLREFEVKLRQEDELVQRELEDAKQKTPIDLKFIWIPEQHEDVKGHLRWFFEKAVDKGVNLKKYPHLSDWVGYYILQDEISSKDLFAELTRYETAVLSQIKLSEQAKTFLVLDANYAEVKKLISLELSRTEWNEIKQENLNLKPLAKQLCALYKETFQRKPKINLWDALKLIKLFDSAKSNYQIVEERDTVLAKGIQQNLEQTKASKIAVITGGFHTDMLAAFLKGHQIGYAVISPVIRDVNKKLNYRVLVDPELSQTRQPVVSAFGDDQEIIPFRHRLESVEKGIASNLPTQNAVNVLTQVLPPTATAAAASLGKKNKDKKKTVQRSRMWPVLIVTAGVFAVGSITYSTWRAKQSPKPVVSNETPGLKAPPIREDLRHRRFEYEKREKILIPPDFPLLMIPMIHQGKDQETIVFARVREELKKGSNILWIEGGANPSFKGMVTNPQMQALQTIPEIQLALENPGILLSDIIQNPTVKENLERALQHIRNSGRFQTFEMLNQKGPQAKSKEEKKQYIQTVFGENFTSSMMKEAIDDATALIPETSTFPTWIVTHDFERITPMADLHLSFNDLEGAYFYEELAFHFMVEMVYLRDRELWSELKQLHEQKEYRDARFVVPIGSSHLVDFDLAPHQISIPTGAHTNSDIVDFGPLVKEELNGTLDPTRKRVLFEGFYFDNILVGRSSTITSDYGKLNRTLQSIRQRMADRKITPGDLIRELGQRLLELRKKDPRFKDREKVPFIRPYMLEMLLEKKLMDAQEVLIIEGKSLGESETLNRMLAGHFATLKAPTADPLLNRINSDFKFIASVIHKSRRVEIPDKLITELRRRGPPFEKLVNALLSQKSPKICFYVTEHPAASHLFGIPRYEGAILARDTVPAYTLHDNRGDLCIYVTNDFYQMMLHDLALFAFVLDHEFYEKFSIPNQPHEKVWRDRGWLEYFVDAKTGLNKYIKTFIDRLADEGDVEGLDRFKSTTSQTGKLVYEYAQKKQAEVLARRKLYLTIKPDVDDKEIDAWRVKQAKRSQGINLEVQQYKFDNEEFYVYVPNPEYIKDKTCTLFFNKTESNRELLKLLFTVELLEDCGAKSIRLILPADVPAWLNESLRAFARIDLVYSRQARNRREHDSLDVRGEPLLQKKNRIPPPPVREFDRILVMPNADKFEWSGMSNLAYIQMDNRGKIVIPQGLRSGGNYLLLAMTDRHNEILRLLETLSALARRGIYPTVFVPYFSYGRQHQAYPVPRHGPEAKSDNSARAILKAISQFSSRLYGVNLHFTKSPGEMDVEKEFPGLGSYIQIHNLNLFPQLVHYFQENNQLIHPVIVGADKGAKLFAEEASRITGIEYGGHMDKDRDSSQPTHLQIDMKLNPEFLPVNVDGRDVILLDDLIASGTTIINAALLLKSRGARRVFVGTVYGEFTKGIEIFNNKDVIQKQIEKLKSAGQFSDVQFEYLNSALSNAPLINRVMATDIMSAIDFRNSISLTQILDLKRLMMNESSANAIPSSGASLGLTMKQQLAQAAFEIVKTSPDIRADGSLRCGNLIAVKLHERNPQLYTAAEQYFGTELELGGFLGMVIKPVTRQILYQNSKELDDLLARIKRNKDRWLIAIDGESGAGKSRLFHAIRDKKVSLGELFPDMAFIEGDKEFYDLSDKVLRQMPRELSIIRPDAAKLESWIDEAAAVIERPSGYQGDVKNLIRIIVRYRPGLGFPSKRLAEYFKAYQDRILVFNALTGHGIVKQIAEQNPDFPPTHVAQIVVIKNPDESRRLQIDYFNIGGASETVSARSLGSTNQFDPLIFSFDNGELVTQYWDGNWITTLYDRKKRYSVSKKAVITASSDRREAVNTQTLITNWALKFVKDNNIRSNEFEAVVDFLDTHAAQKFSDEQWTGGAWEDNPINFEYFKRAPAVDAAKILLAKADKETGGRPLEFLFDLHDSWAVSGVSSFLTEAGYRTARKQKQLIVKAARLAQERNDLLPPANASSLGANRKRSKKEKALASLNPIVTHFGDHSSLVTQWVTDRWMTVFYDASGASVSGNAFVWKNLSSSKQWKRPDIRERHNEILHFARQYFHTSPVGRWVPNQSQMLQLFDEFPQAFQEDVGFRYVDVWPNPIRIKNFQEAAEDLRDQKNPNFLTLRHAATILLAKAETQSPGLPFDYLFGAKKFSFKKAEGKDANYDASGAFLSQNGFDKSHPYRNDVIVEAARMFFVRQEILKTERTISSGASLGRSEEVELAGEKYLLKEVPENEKLGINIQDLSPDEGLGDQKVNLHLFVKLYHFISEILHGNDSLLRKQADDFDKAQMLRWLDPEDPEGNEIATQLPARLSSGPGHILRDFFNEEEIKIISSIQADDPAWFFRMSADQQVLLHVSYQLMIHLLRIIRDRDVLDDLKKTFEKERSRWKTEEVKAHFIPLQFHAFFSLFNKSKAGEFRAEDEIRPLIRLLSDQKVPVRRNREGKWAKDHRFWLPPIDGHPRYYLLTDMQDQTLIKISKTFEKDIFNPGLKNKVPVDINEGGAVVSGVAATPFMIFSDRIEHAKINDLVSKIKTMPGYETTHGYTLPSGYVTLKYQSKTYLIDNGHLDTVIGFIPARLTHLNKNILLIDPGYHREVIENPEFKRLVAEQNVIVIDVADEETQFNPTNFGILPDGRLFFNYSPKTLAKLHLKDGTYVNIANESDAMKLMPILGGSTGCLMGLEEITPENEKEFALSGQTPIKKPVEALPVKIRVEKSVISEMLRGMKGVTPVLIEAIYQKAKNVEGGFLSDSALQRFVEREYDLARKSNSTASGQSLGKPSEELLNRFVSSVLFLDWRARHAIRSLANQKYGRPEMTVGELIQITEKELLMMRNVGPATIAEIQECLKDEGLSLAKNVDGKNGFEQVYGNSLGSVLVVMDATGKIIGLDLMKIAPEIARKILDDINSAKAVLKNEMPSLVITGPVSVRALLIQIKEHKTVIAYYENEEFKKEFERQAEVMKSKGEILQEELDRYGYFAYLPKLHLTRAEFVRQVLKNVKLDYDGVGRRSLGRIATESRIRNFMSRVVWEGDEALIQDVIEKLPVIVGRPLKVGSAEAQDHTERDIAVLKLASLLSQDPEALEKKGFLILQNGIYVPTDLFMSYLDKAIQEHNFEKLTASMA